MTEEEDPFDAYHDLADTADDHRWAYGTGFHDALEGVDTTVPEGVDGSALAAYCLMLGDDALILSHRLQQWISRAPELEEESAIGNIGLDLLGQTRMLYSRAGKADGSGRTEDQLAFFRNEPEFRNVRLVERADADFAEMIARLLVMSTFRLAVFERLCDSKDPVLAAIAAKGAKELAYHRDYAAGWTVRLGDGTQESHRRMQAALQQIWPLVDELFHTHPVERALPGVAVESGSVRGEVDVLIDQVLAAATLDRPDARPLAGLEMKASEHRSTGVRNERRSEERSEPGIDHRRRGRYGRDGLHTEALGYVLAELQSVARAYPDATW